MFFPAAVELSNFAPNFLTSSRTFQLLVFQLLLFPTSLTFEKHKTGDVACRQLGYERVAQIGRDALGLETPSSAPIILEWVNCTGTEPSLSKCKGEFYFRWLERYLDILHGII